MIRDHRIHLLIIHKVMMGRPVPLKFGWKIPRVRPRYRLMKVKVNSIVFSSFAIESQVRSSMHLYLRTIDKIGQVTSLSDRQ